MSKIRSTLAASSSRAPSRTRRHAGLGLLALVSVGLAALPALAGCYGDEDDGKGTVTRAPDYLPADAASQPPLAPGVGPAPDPTGTSTSEPPTDAGPDRTSPPADAATEAAPPTEAGPVDAAAG